VGPRARDNGGPGLPAIWMYTLIRKWVSQFAAEPKDAELTRVQLAAPARILRALAAHRVVDAQHLSLSHVRGFMAGTQLTKGSSNSRQRGSKPC